MKIALVQCPVWGTYDPPLALAQLSSCLKNEGNDVYAFDLNIKLYSNRSENYKNTWAWEQSLFWYDPEKVNNFFKDNNGEIEEHLKIIINTGARVIGFSVNAASRLSSIELAKRLKSINKDLIVIFGGPLFFERRFVESVLNEETIDIVVSGEGENAFCEIIQLIEKNKDINSCKGITYKKNGNILNTPPREQLVNLDSLPFLDFTDLPLNNYDDSKHIPFMASRGCIQRCAFCSSRTFWPGYRSMSGERIFREFEFHKRKNGKLNSKLGHVDFLDLLFNGNMNSLIDFCELMDKARLDICWTANMIIRREMDFDVIKKMKRAGCEHVIFGIESGSQRVLDQMKKNYRIEDADRILGWMHDAGIIVTCNFMFGFPGETEADFALTLDFLKRNAKFLDRAYPSRTFFAIEEFSYLHSHLEEFGIKPNPPNHLYWESNDGQNIYPERLLRCDKFCTFAASLGIEVASGVQTSVELDKYYNLGFYYEHKKDYQKAISCFMNYNKLDPKNDIIFNKISAYNRMIKEKNPDIGVNSSLALELKELIDRNNENGQALSVRQVFKLSREPSPALLKQKQKENSQLNDKEYEAKKIILESSPKNFFLQVSGPCNSSCVFCSRGTDYEFFNLATHISRFEEKLNTYLQKAEKIILTGSGEFLLLPEAEAILDYFNVSFPQAEKMFSTNGVCLSPGICEKIVGSKSKYSIHVSLHSSNGRLHKLLTRNDNFQRIIGQLNYLINHKNNTANPTVNLIFVATTLNIEDLPNFIRLAANLRVDKVICYYNYIYIPAQKYLSCFFKQELTNRMLEEAENLASKLNVKIDLPPRFGLEDYPLRGICQEAWSQIMINAQSHIIPCDAYEGQSESLENKDFLEIWNSPYYQNLRRSLIEKSNSCFQHCFRANPSAVNDFSSHVIRRGKKESEISILWGDNF